MAKIGYAASPPATRDHATQESRLRAAGCEIVRAEKASGNPITIAFFALTRRRVSFVSTHPAFAMLANPEDPADCQTIIKAMRMRLSPEAVRPEGATLH